MLYFSEIQGKKVYTEDDVYVGKLIDFIFLASDKPKITKLVIRTQKNPGLIVSVDSLLRISVKVLLAKNYQEVSLAENELYLLKNLLDTQIIDIAGSKIIRVNDVAIAEGPDYHIAGVDIGFLGILRRLGLEDIAIKFLRIFKRQLISPFLSWADIQPLELARGHVQIKKDEKRLSKIRPEDLADYLEKTNIINVRKILNIMDEKKAAEVIGELNINYQTALFRHLKSEKIAKIISLIEPEEATDVLLTLPKRKRENILSLLDTKAREEIEYLLRLSKTPIGDALSTDYLVVDSTITSRQVMVTIRKETRDFHILNYIYVVNKENQLVGVISLHELILQDPDRPIYKYMTQNLSVIHLTTPELVVFKKMVKYKLSALPVLDGEKRMLGIVNFDDIVDLITHFND